MGSGLIMTYTDEELLKLDPEIEHIFNTKGTPKIRMPTRKTIPIFRKGFDATMKKYNSSAFVKAALGPAFDDPTWTEADHTIPTRDGRRIKAKTYSPKPLPADGVAVVIVLHGGGWFMGSLATDEFTCRLFCAKLGVMVVNVDYGLYPEVQFPVPILDCHDAVKWTARETPAMGANLSKGFIVSGNSGGATYGAVAAHLARDDNMHPPLTGCHFTCPILTDETFDEHGKPAFIFDHETEYRSWWQNAEAPLMNEKTRLGISEFATYERMSPLLTPFHFPSHANLPPTYVAVCGIDPWRDGGILYQRELEKAGCAVKLDCYPGMLHCWWSTYPQVSKTQEWLRNTVDGMKWLLAQPDKRTVSSKL